MIYTYGNTDDIFVQPQGSEDGIKVIGDGAVNFITTTPRDLKLLWW